MAFTTQILVICWTLQIMFRSSLQDPCYELSLYSISLRLSNIKSPVIIVSDKL